MYVSPYLLHREVIDSVLDSSGVLDSLKDNLNQNLFIITCFISDRTCSCDQESISLQSGQAKSVQSLPSAARKYVWWLFRLHIDWPHLGTAPVCITCYSFHSLYPTVLIEPFPQSPILSSSKCSLLPAVHRFCLFPVKDILCLWSQAIRPLIARTPLNNLI